MINKLGTFVGRKSAIVEEEELEEEEEVEVRESKTATMRTDKNEVIASEEIDIEMSATSDISELESDGFTYAIASNGHSARITRNLHFTITTTGTAQVHTLDPTITDVK